MKKSKTKTSNVALESDKNIKRLKGKKRPIHDQNKRCEMLESLSFVDKVIILKDKMTDQDYINLVDKVRPCQIAVTKGDAMINKKREQAKRVGAKLIEIPKITSPSTTEILKILKTD
ncbi:MAG: hypothetical protein NT162_02115 [Candidatus Woesebacteria bacterium]|nr:hypothetical protein [Candidatus Woesebacteria bacterium]